MMTGRFRIIAVMVLVLAGSGGLVGCAELDLPLLESPCRYVEIEGTARIVEVRDADPGEYSCPAEPVTVVFEFTPADPAGRSYYRYPGSADSGRLLKVGSGMDPPRKWADEQGLKPGSVHPAVRRELIHGACTPVLYDFPELDFAGADKLCYPE